VEVKNSYNYEETQMKQIVLNIKARILKCFEVLKDSSHFIGYKGGTSSGGWYFNYHGYYVCSAKMGPFEAKFP